MKIAELPDGSELFFPDEYDDEQMDKAVMRYLEMSAKNEKEQINEIRLLRESIEGGISKIATILAAPKVLERDWQDRPIGVKPKLNGADNG